MNEKPLNDDSCAVLVLGQGGREHALVRALCLSPSLARGRVHAAPGSDGIAQDATCHAWDGKDRERLAGIVRAAQIDLVVVGPETYLADGIADHLRALGVAVFGPDRAAARLESSKVFAKQFMVRANVPTAAHVVVAGVAETLQAAEGFAPPYVLKADGLAAGKGVFICPTLLELEQAAHVLFTAKSLGDAGASALLEEFTAGFEISFLILCNGSSYEPLVLAQDHKRLCDGDTGPNTGGMGTFAPFAISQELEERIEREILRPVMAEMQRSAFLYRGVLFIGLMIDKQGHPSVLEFNVRFGDPETQVILPLLDGDWHEVLRTVAGGGVPRLKWRNSAAACVVLAAAGYPEAVKNGAAIPALRTAALDFGCTTDSSSYALHAGTHRQADGGWISAGGRVLNAVGLGETAELALRHAYREANGLAWDGCRFRLDIGKALGPLLGAAPTKNV